MLAATTRRAVADRDRRHRRAPQQQPRRACPQSTAHAAKATRFVFEKLVRVDPADQARLRLPLEQRVAATHLGLGADRRNGQRRPAYDVLRDRLRRLRISGHLGSVGTPPAGGGPAAGRLCDATPRGQTSGGVPQPPRPRTRSWRDGRRYNQVGPTTLPTGTEQTISVYLLQRFGRENG